MREQEARGSPPVPAALVLIVHLAHAQVDVARRTVRGYGVGADEARREQLGQLGQRHALGTAEVLQDVQDVGAPQVLFQGLAVLELQQLLQCLAAGELAQIAQHALADLTQLLVAKQRSGIERSVVLGQCAQQLGIVLGHHVHGVAGTPDHAAVGGVQAQMVGRRAAGAQRPALQQLRLVGRACTVGPDLQVQGLAGFGVTVQDLAHHGQPLGKELLEVAVGIDAVDEGGGTTGLQQLVQLPGEAAEVRVGGVAQPEDGVAQPGQRIGLLDQCQEGLRIGGRLPVAELRGDDEQRVPVLQHAGRDFVQGEDLGGEGLQGRVGGQLLGQSAGIARLRPIADHHAVGDGVHVSWLGETSGVSPMPRQGSLGRAQ